MTNHQPVLSVVFVTGEEINSTGLPTLTVYQSRDGFFIGGGIEAIEQALSDSLSHLREPNYTVVFLAVDLRPASRRKRRLG